MNNIVYKFCKKITRCIQRKRLKATNFSIITNSCIGGVIYHELGQQFRSPTINLWMQDVDFYKFATNLEEYINTELRFVTGIANYPTAYCNDVLIHFNHYKTEEEAATKWYERCKRINWNKIYIITSDRPCGDRIVTHKDMLSLKNIKCANKVIFSTREYDDIDYIVHLPKDKDGDFVKAYMFDKIPIIKFFRWEFLWDYVGWLNKGRANEKK